MSEWESLNLVVYSMPRKSKMKIHTQKKGVKFYLLLDDNSHKPLWPYVLSSSITKSSWGRKWHDLEKDSLKFFSL